MASRALGDKLIAALAVAPFVYGLYHEARGQAIDVPLATWYAQVGLLAVTMLLRRPPRRVTRNLWLWLLAFGATYSGFLLGPLFEEGRPLVQKALGDGLAIVSLLLMAVARLSLGRNIGLRPRAARDRDVRGLRLGAAPDLQRPVPRPRRLGPERLHGPQRLARPACALLFVVKAVAEERFLAADADYARYLQRVPWRCVPFLA